MNICGVRLANATSNWGLVRSHYPLLRSVTLFDDVLADGLQEGFGDRYSALGIGRPPIEGFCLCFMNAGLVKRRDRLRNELVGGMAPRRHGRLYTVDRVTGYQAACCEREAVPTQEGIELLNDRNLLILVPV